MITGLLNETLNVIRVFHIFQEIKPYMHGYTECLERCSRSFVVLLNEKMKSKPFDGEHYCKTIHNMTEATQDIYLETTHVFHLMCQLHI